MDDISARILRAAIATCEQRILPALTEDSSKIYGGLLLHSLKFVQSRTLNLEAAQTARAGGRTIFRKAAGDTAEAYTRMLAAVEQGGPEGAAAAQTLDRLIAAEVAFLAGIDEGCIGGGGDSFRGGRKRNDERASLTSDGHGSGVEVPTGGLDAPSLTRWARAKWPDDPAVRVDEVHAIPGGFSKSTAFFTLHRGGRAHRYVLRRDLPTPLMGQSVVAEYAPLVHLANSGFPVAKPLLVEPDRRFVNGAFMVSERLSGSVDFTAWKDDAAKVAVVARQLAKLMADLHNMPLQALGYSQREAKQSAAECMRTEVQRFYELYQRKTREDLPLLELAFAWLLRNIPASLQDRPARMLHGDVGFHNLLVHEGRVSALLDWEFHHLGDPAEDLCYARQFIEQVMPWENFLELYRQAGGEGYPANDDFFSVWTATRNPAGCVDSVALFAGELPEAIQLAVAGHIFGPRLQVDAAQKVMNLIKGGLA